MPINQNINVYLLKQRRVIFIIIGVFLLLVINLVITSIPFLASIDSVSPKKKLIESGVITAFITVIIIAPIIETILFQYLPITIISFFLKENKYIKPITIIISAISFSVVHIYNYTYFIMAFIGGLIFAYLFILSKQRKENPVVNLLVIHTLLNLIPFTRDFII